MRIDTQRSFLIVAALMLGVVFNHTRAEAKCAAPQDTWSLDGGRSIPAKATLFFFAVSWSDDMSPATVKANGKTLKSEWKRVSKNDAFTTYRLSFDAGSAKQVQVSRGANSQGHGVMAWSAPKEATATATVGSRIRDSWTCSHTDVVPLRVKSKASAFRVEWSDPRSGAIDAGNGTIVFPRSALSFWRHQSTKRETAVSIELGHPNCFAYNLPGENLASLDLRVTPLYRDGSEGKAISLQHRKKAVKDEEPEAPRSEATPVVESVVPIPVQQQQASPAIAAPTSKIRYDRQKSRASGVTLRLLVLASLFGTLFGLLIFRSHRHGVETRRIVRTGAAVSISCGSLAWGAAQMAFPRYLFFFAGGLAVLFFAARYLEVKKD